MSSATIAFYWVMATVCGLLVSWFSVRPLILKGAARSRWSGVESLGFCASLFVCLIAWRWPSVLFPQSLNPDESQMIAQALKFMFDPIPWRAVDSTTSGPLNSYALIVPTWCGAELGFASARSVALVCLGGVAVTTYYTMRSSGSEAVGRIVAASFCFFVASATFGEYVHYSSEVFPMLLLSSGICLGWKAVRRAGGMPSLFLAGLCLGAVPFAKLQAGPIAVVMFLVLLVFVWNDLANPKDRWKAFGIFCVGGLSVPAVILSTLIATNHVNDFWQSYIKIGGVYRAFMMLPWDVVVFVARSKEFVVFVAGAVLAAVVAWWEGRRYPASTGTEDRRLQVLVAIYALITLLVIVKPARDYFHYFLLAVQPIAMGLGLVTRRLFFRLETQPSDFSEVSRQRARNWAILVLCIWLGPLTVQRLSRAPQHPYLNNMRIRKKPHQDRAVEVIRGLTHSNDKLAVWGWEADFYLRTKMIPATRDVVTCMVTESHFVDLPAGRRRYYQERFVKDIVKSRPAVFVDAVCRESFWLNQRPTQGHEQLPALAEFIENNYALALDTGAVNGDGIRVFVLQSE